MTSQTVTNDLTRRTTTVARMRYYINRHDTTNNLKQPDQENYHGCQNVIFTLADMTSQTVSNDLTRRNNMVARKRYYINRHDTTNSLKRQAKLNTVTAMKHKLSRMLASYMTLTYIHIKSQSCRMKQ